MPTTTDTQLASNACLLLGANDIDSFADGSVEAQAANALYERALKSLLCERRWSFSVKISQLSQLVAEPESDRYSKAYQLPPDFLKLWRLNPDYINYDLYGTSYIFADYDGALFCEYTFRPDTRYFPDYFCELLEARLAVKFCMPITEDEKKLQTMMALEKEIMVRAKAADAQQRRGVKIRHFSLIDVRG